MDLSIQRLTKAFNRKTVFKELSFEVSSGSRFAISGPNGSGKSTLLKILSGGALPSSGKVFYALNRQNIPEDQLFRLIHFVAPYNTVIEELTLKELFTMHQKLGLLLDFISFDSWFRKLDYPFVSDQQIKMYSSGMKQRVKLGLALLDNRPLILLDEPGSNLDQKGKFWLHTLLDSLASHQTLIIASNDQSEIAACKELLDLGKE